MKRFFAALVTMAFLSHALGWPACAFGAPISDTGNHQGSAALSSQALMSAVLFSVRPLALRSAIWLRQSLRDLAWSLTPDRHDFSSLIQGVPFALGGSGALSLGLYALVGLGFSDQADLPLNVIWAPLYIGPLVLILHEFARPAHFQKSPKNAQAYWSVQAWPAILGFVAGYVLSSWLLPAPAAEGLKLSLGLGGALGIFTLGRTFLDRWSLAFLIHLITNGPLSLIFFNRLATRDH